LRILQKNYRQKSSTKNYRFNTTLSTLKKYFSENAQLVVISIIWVIFGMFTGPVVYIIVPLTLFLLYRKQMHLEILLGFFFILTLSDSRLHALSFAASVKNIYILILFLITIKEMRLLENRISFFKYFIPFFLVALVCMFFSPNIGISFQKTLSYFLLFFSVPNYFYIVYKKYGDTLFKAIVFLVSVILVLGLVINVFKPDITNLVGRYRGLLGNPNGIGLYTFLFILFFATVNDARQDIFTRYEKIIIYGIAFFSLLKCGGRTSLVTTLLFFFFKKFYKISPWLGFVIFVLSLYIYQLISNNLADIITYLGLADRFRVNSLENGSGRTVAWEFAWQQIQDNFFIGRGFSYTEYIFRINYDYLSMLGHQGAAHNAYLTIWLDTGLVGLLFYLLGLLVTFVKASINSKLAFPVLFAILFSNNYESWLTASLNPFTIQLLFILTFILINSKKPSVNLITTDG
jgi:O-antigen ligase